jgi:hypothetical protein
MDNFFLLQCSNVIVIFIKVFENKDFITILFDYNMCVLNINNRSYSKTQSCI